MASTYYLGQLSTGRLVSRKSNRDDFTHAALRTDAHASQLASFSTSAQGALSNANPKWKPETLEVVPVRKVTAKEFRAALASVKGA